MNGSSWPGSPTMRALGKQVGDVEQLIRPHLVRLVDDPDGEATAGYVARFDVAPLGRGTDDDLGARHVCSASVRHDKAGTGFEVSVVASTREAPDLEVRVA